LLLPMRIFHEEHGVQFGFLHNVTDIQFDSEDGRIQATRIAWVAGGEPGRVDLGPAALGLATLRSLAANSVNSALLPPPGL
ncbi:oleate hydratase, partial [Microbacterium sp. GbtcB4]|uniref:oleate hydratase n=1 Tax=Microbacterium sp. GbtcB4 TaxID=2824749 RepID=UPI001C309A6D